MAVSNEPYDFETTIIENMIIHVREFVVERFAQDFINFSNVTMSFYFNGYVCICIELTVAFFEYT